MKICLRRSLVPTIKVSEMRFPSQFKRRVLKGHCKRGCCFRPQTVAPVRNRLRVRRSLKGASAAVWRSRADDPAGTGGEPKGAMVLSVFPFITHSRRKGTKGRRSTWPDTYNTYNTNNTYSAHRTDAGSASAQPLPFAPQGRAVFRGAKGRVVPCPASGYATSPGPCKNFRMAAIRR